MSIELLVLLVVFILLPLIQQLLRAMQERDQGSSGRPHGRRPPTRRPTMPEPQPAADVPLPRAPAVPPLPPATQHTVPAVTAHKPLPRRETSRPVAPALTARRDARRHTAIGSLRNPFDLRRAIVVMTILGPCRAISPSDWPERSARR